MEPIIVPEAKRGKIMASENQSGGLILGAFMSAKRECDLNNTIDTEL